MQLTCLQVSFVIGLIILLKIGYLFNLITTPNPPMEGNLCITHILALSLETKEEI
jgi:hypothetical protein